VPAPIPTPARTVAINDLRRTISRPIWLANRARNALRRPAFIGAISVGTFVTALVSMVITPRADQQPVTVPLSPRPDTLSLIGNAGVGRVRIVELDSVLTAARGEAMVADSAAAALALTDTMVIAAARRDSVQTRVDRLSALIARAEQAPLPSSYKALAAAPELRQDARVRSLVDSLTDIERERDGFGAVGGVDPIFVALTSRASEIGRAIQSIATAQRNAMVSTLAPAAPAAPVIAAVATVDTIALVTTRDSIRAAVAAADQELIRRRELARELDLEEARARERATAVAPPLALLAAAFVLSAVLGFAAAFVGELRRPRVSDANELERFLGVRTLSTVETPMPSAERGRREADRAAPPYFDPSAEGYQLAYLGLANEHPTLLMTTVTGDDPAIAAVVACNLAAVAADEARNTLVVDLEPTCRASAALRARIQPGIRDMLHRDVSWPDVTVAAQVGRNKTVDLVPCGVGGTPDSEDMVELLRRDSSRLARYYDAIFIVAPATLVAAGVPAALPSPEVIFCAQPGLTPLRQLRTQLDAIRAGGGSVRGIVLWNAERPMLPTSRELLTRPSKQKPREKQVAVTTS
jgi:Mrp family chromosome partitioning ATPase